MGHIVSSCKTALLRHDQVLREIADILEMERRKKRQSMKDKSSFIQFVREGEKRNNKITSNAGILDRTNSLEMRVDIGRRLAFPDVVQTFLRPDVVIWSDRSS